MPPLMVGVFDAETRLSLMARHAPGGDEVAATLGALKAVTLKGCTVTADALHCHPAMAEATRARGGHYALRLKANHGPLFACVKKAFANADAAAASLSTSSPTADMAAANDEGPASSRSRPARRPFPASPLSAASKPNEPSAAEPRPRSITPPSRRLSPRGAFCKSCERIGASRTSFTGRSTSSSAKTTPERARTTPRKTSLSCAASPSTSCEPVPTLVARYKASFLPKPEEFSRPPARLGAYRTA